MEINFARIIRITLTILVLVAYPLLAHFSSVSTIDGWAALAVVVGPLLLLILIHARTSTYRLPLLLACCTAIAGLFLYRTVIGQNLSWVSFAQHAGSNAILCYVFGRTLYAGRTPLVSRMALMLEGTLQPEVARYTCQVTYAWTLFFGLNALLSTLLFLFAPLVTWSVFANILYLPLLLAMFGIEYLVRVLVLPRSVHTNLFITLQSAWKTFASSRS